MDNMWMWESFDFWVWQVDVRSMHTDFFIGLWTFEVLFKVVVSGMLFKIYVYFVLHVLTRLKQCLSPLGFDLRQQHGSLVIILLSFLQMLIWFKFQSFNGFSDRFFFYYWNESNIQETQQTFRNRASRLFCFWNTDENINFFLCLHETHKLKFV